MSTHITGKLVRAGYYLEENQPADKPLSASVTIIMTRESLAEVKQLPMYDEVTVIRSEELAALRATIKSQIEWWKQVPSGPDYDADPKNESPDDAVAHIAGLAIREARAALREDTK